jgi:Putative transmembrane protein (PGPGW)
MSSPKSSTPSALGRLRQKVANSRFGRAPVLLRKIVVGVIGSTILLLGVALILLPGPAILVIPLGLGVLATEFVWARRVLERGRLFVRTLGSRMRRSAPK